MELKEYVENATRTESLVDAVVVNPELLGAVMQLFIASGNMLDQIKKHAFYGKSYDQEKFIGEFKNIVGSLDQLKTAIRMDALDVEGPVGIDPRVFHSVVGIATEATELMEALTREDVDRVNLLEEFGDLNWYQAIGIDALEGDFHNVLVTNIDKLRARYPDKFDSDKAINRDLEAEREILERDPLTE